MANDASIYYAKINGLSEYIPSFPYKKGQMVTKNGKVYRAVRNVAEGNEWKRSEWTPVNYEEYVKKSEEDFVYIENATVNPSSWVEWHPQDKGQWKMLNQFPYRACIPCKEVTEDMIPYVLFNSSEALSGKFSNIAESVNKGVYIYCAEIPTDVIIVPLVKCLKIKTE